MSDEKHGLDKRFVIERQGKPFVLYAGLLDLATERGLTRLETEVVSATADFALFKATATFGDGRVFVEHGDATPKNVGRTIAEHFVRMAATRAKARALRDALNIGVTALEELGPDEEAVPTPAPTVRVPSPIRPAPAPPKPIPATPAAPAVIPAADEVEHLSGEALGDACRRMLVLVKAANVPYGPFPKSGDTEGWRGWWRTSQATLVASARPVEPAAEPAAAS